MDFIIGALPRSGTAWLATALNCHPEIVCYHEAEKYSSVTYKHPGKKVGNCSSAAPLMSQGDPPLRISLVRDEGEAFASLIQVVPELREWELILEAFWDWDAQADLRIRFDDLFTLDPYWQICEALGLETKASDNTKVRQLCKLNVQLNSIDLVNEM